MQQIENPWRRCIAAIAVRLMLGMTFMAATASTATAADLQGLDNPTLSLNLSGANDYSPGLQFLDLMKFGRAWTGHEAGKWGGMKFDEIESEGYLDANGWPTTIPDHLERIGTFWQWNDHPDDVAHREGVYVVNYEGEGDLRLSGDITLLPSEPGEIKFQAHGGSFFLNIHDTDPNGTGNHLRDITMVKEEHLDLYEAGAVFNPAWLELIDDARELRFMGWMETNNSNVTSWEDYPTAESGPNGKVALEHMVQLANEVGADPWFTMPHNADETFIRNFATYVRDNLDPALSAKVEYSNEVWNWAFQQTHWLKDQAADEWGVTGGRGYIDYHAKKAVETALIWQEVFGDEAEDRLINVLGTQASNPGVTARLFDPVNWYEAEPDTFVNPADVFDAVAVTTYFGSSVVANSENRDALIAAIKDPDIDAYTYLHDKMLDPDVKGSIPENAERLEKQAEIAAKYGLDLVAYEGGQHLHHSFAVRGLSKEDVAILTNFMTDFVRSPEMADLYKKSWESWSEISDGAYNQHGDMTKPNKWGSWGIHESLDTITERGAALTELNETETPWWDAEGGAHYQQGIVAAGTEDEDLLVGTSAEDYLLGDKGDDILMAGAGNDGINGGEGVDRAVLSGSASDYRIEVEGNGYRVTGPDGSDFLIDVEELQFDGGEIYRLAEIIDQPGPAPAAPSEGMSTEEQVEKIEEAVLPDDDKPETPTQLTMAEDNDESLILDSTQGVVVRSINPFSKTGNALDLSGSDEAAFVATARGIETEIDGQTVGANYWSLNEGKASQDGASLGDDPMTLIEALGGVVSDAGVISTGSGDDLFFGRNEEKVVFTGDGRDYLAGRGGSDTLDGGAGMDTLVGGADDDLLTGGTGQDTFIMWKGNGHDRITDFEPGTDTLKLDGYFAEGSNIRDAVSYTDSGMLISNGTDSVLLEGITETDLVRIEGIAPEGAIEIGGAIAGNAVRDAEPDNTPLLGAVVRDTFTFDETDTANVVQDDVTTDRLELHAARGRTEDRVEAVLSDTDETPAVAQHGEDLDWVAPEPPLA